MKYKRKQDKNILLRIFKGDFLSKKSHQEQLPFILFVVSLIIVNITLYYNAEKLAININKAEKELYELRVEYITTKSELMTQYKRSTIEKTVNSMGIKSSLVAPRIIEE